MTISNTTWIILIVTVCIAIITMFVVFGVMYYKIRKVKKDTLEVMSQSNSLKESAAFKRKHPGELLWDLKAKTKNPLEDEQLEFILNTAIRNEYKTCHIINNSSSYEEESLLKIAKVKQTNIKPDLIIIFPTIDLQDVFDIEYKKLIHKKMIIVPNALKKNKQIKNLISYLKLTKTKYDLASIGKGVLLIVK